MFRLLSPLPLSLAIAALCLVTTGCGSKSTQVRVINAMDSTANSSGVNLEFNSVSTFTSAISFGQILPAIPSPPAATYTTVPSGSDTIEVFNAGSTTDPIVTSTQTLDSGSQYTLILESQTVTALLDNNTSPNTSSNSSNVEFRVIDASTYYNSVDVYLLQTPNSGIQNVTPNFSLGNTQQSAYTTLPWNSNSTSPGYELIVTVSGSKNEIINQSSLGVPTGSITTLVLMDEVNNNQAYGLSPTPLVLQDID